MHNEVNLNNMAEDGNVIVMELNALHFQFWKEGKSPRIVI